MKNKTWIILVIIILSLTIITYTPLVTPAGQFTPKVMGVPYTLWMGFLITCLIVFATYLATKVHPSQKEEKSNTND